MAYQILNSIFQRYDSDLEPSEAHGIATAMLCVDGHSDGINWLKEIFDEEVVLLEEEKAILCELFEQTRKLLNPNDSMFEFDLFLPEEFTLSEQAMLLANWCKGFLWGVGYSDSQGDWQGETRDILRDMVEFTKLDDEVEDDNDEDDEAFVQIHEYLRAAVLIVRDELNQPSKSEH